MFDLGIQELIVIFIVALIVFGPKRLPELGRSIGKGLREIKKAMYDIKAEVDSELRNIDEIVKVEEEITKEEVKSEVEKEDKKEDEKEA